MRARVCLVRALLKPLERGVFLRSCGERAMSFLMAILDGCETECLVRFMYWSKGCLGVAIPLSKPLCARSPFFWSVGVPSISLAYSMIPGQLGFSCHKAPDPSVIPLLRHAKSLV